MSKNLFFDNLENNGNRYIRIEHGGHKQYVGMINPSGDFHTIAGQMMLYHDHLKGRLANASDKDVRDFLIGFAKGGQFRLQSVKAWLGRGECERLYETDAFVLEALS